MKRALLLSVLILFQGGAADAATAPKLTALWASWLPQPLPLPYDEKADAKQAVADAFARAKTSGKRVLIDFGGNWCPDCRILAGVMALPAMKPFMDAHFEMVSVDVDRFNRNLDIAKSYGAKITAVPYLIIARPDGKVLVSSYDVTGDSNSRPQLMANWIARWAD